MEPATLTEHGGGPNPLDTKGLCLLSLDGGGVRGLSTLYILKNLVDQLNSERKSAPPLKPCDIFDLIGGTSTGGLIAIMLGRLEMDVDECILAYTKLMKAVFVEKSSRLPISLRGKVKARFDSKKLKGAVEEVISSTGASPSDYFNDGKDRGCRTFVCATAKETAGVTRIRTYTALGESSISATVCEAALATSAATGFFDPVSIGARQFVDGALGANNPVDEVEGEAADIWSPGTGDLKPLVKCFISIGTGHPGKKALEDGMLGFLSKSLVGIATETEETERKFIARWARHLDEKRFFRFNVDQGLQNVGLAEHKEQGRVEAATSEYLSHQDRKFRVRDCVQNLKLKQNKTETCFAPVVEEYTRRCIVLSQRTTHEARWSVPFERNRQFVGRNSQLHRLESTLFTKHQPAKIAISGLGGMGKTQIVLELAYRAKETHPQCSVFWVPATSAESLQQAFTDIGRQLGVLGNEEKHADVKKLVQQRLSQPSAGEWLFIVDNIDEIGMWNDELRDYLPKSQQGCVICTTRSRKVAVRIAAAPNVIEVPEMDEEMAMQLLAKSLINQELLSSHQDAMKLLEELTYLPLAIVQAAAYINENGIELRQYLSLLEEQEQDVIELLSEDFEDDGRYKDIKNPVATTWLISFQQIQQIDSLAAEYLSFVSCVDPKDIPQSLLPPAPSRKRETDALGVLDAYSFVSKRPVDQALDVHRLVYLATRNWLRREGQLKVWSAKAIQRLEEVFPEPDHQNRNTWRLYLAHACHVLGQDCLEGADEGRVELVQRLAGCLYRDGRYKEAEIWYLKELKTTKAVLGKEHPNTLTIMHNLALTYVDQGRWKEAEELVLDVLETEKTVLGKEHPNTLTSMHSLALTYWEQGQWREAEKLIQEVLETRKTVLGKKHPNTLTSMHSLALTYLGQGQWKEAEKLGLEVLETCKTVLGKEHPDTLASMHVLALTYWEQGRWKEAKELGLEVLETRKTVLGKEHPNTLISISNLASTYWEQGRWKEAEELELEALETFKTVLGKEHPDTLVSMNNLAVIWRSLGRSTEAMILMQQCVQHRQRVLGDSHPNLVKSLGWLERWKAEEAAEAEAEEAETELEDEWEDV